jgi:ATP-binding cassette, subfamily B, bacterial PglK
MSLALSRKIGRLFRRPGGESDFTSLTRVIGVSWSLLTFSEKQFFILRFVFRAMLNVLDIVAIGLMGVLGGVTATGLSGTRLQFFGYELPAPTASNITLLVGTVAGLFVLKGGLTILFDRWNSIFLAEIEIKNAVKLARYLFGGSLDRLRQQSRAEIQFLLGAGTSAAFSGVLGSATAIALEGSLFISVLVMFLVVDWIAATAIFVYFAIVISLLQLTTARRYLIIGRDIQQATVDGTSSVLEMVDGFREIAVLSKQDFFLRRYAGARKLDARTGVTLEILKSLPRYIAETGLIIGAFGFVVWQLSRGSLGEGLFALGVFLAGSFRMMGAILPLQHIWNNLRVKQKWVKSVHEILEQLRDEPELLDPRIYKFQEFVSTPGVTHAPPEGGLAISVKSVSFTHANKSEPAVSGVSLEVERGSYAAIVGPSGAGKTTLVDLILGLYEPQSGEVLVNGESPVVFRAKLPGLVSYVPQRPGLVTGSIAHNVALGVPDDDIDEKSVWEALERAQLGPLVTSLPDGIHSTLGSHSDALSGGQIQRLGLARALYTKPKLIILDEATSALDAATEASIADAISNLGSDTTVVVIAHRLSTIQHADAVHVLDEGTLVASGTFKEVRQKVPMIEEYVKLMSFDDD